MRPGRDADPSPPSSGKVLKESRAIPVLSLRAFVACKKSETYLLYLYLFEAKYPFVSRSIMALLVCVVSFLAVILTKACIALSKLYPKCVFLITVHNQC
jgi:hypothetical protein